MIKVLGIGGSPRRQGNTDILLDEALKGALSAGAAVEKIYLQDYNISHCRACHACSTTGFCVLEDDMQKLYPLLLGTGHVILASPIQFYGVSSLTKTMIDRLQCMWAKKYVLKKKVYEGNVSRRGVFVSVGATRGKKLFNGAVLTAKYFFDSIDVSYWGELLINGVDGKGEVVKTADNLKQVYELGKNLILKGD